MTTISPEHETNLRIAKPEKSRLEQRVDRASEWMSSILVKESRQALKSRQFLYTFFLMLLVVTLWSVLSLTYIRYEGFDGVVPGPMLLFGFYLILGFPLAIVIPFSSFRSLAHEFEDGTLQLVSITTMKPYQIILGKLGVSLLQIMIYVSVLAPCIAFTYLLRGIDIRQITWGLNIAVVGSVTLCMVGLFVASTTKSRHWGTALSVLFLFGLAIVYWIWGWFAYVITYQYAMMFFMSNDEAVNVGYWGFLFFAASTAFLVFAAAASKISFEADNRSSLIRIAMVVQTILYLSFMTAVLTFQFATEAAFYISIVLTIYWAAMGAMMSAVPAIMSRRVKRSLPTTVLGRSIKSLFMPGPGRGFLFAIANIWGWNLFLLGIFLCARFVLPNTAQGNLFLKPDDVQQIVYSLGGNCIYATLYLSIVFLVTNFSFRRRPNQGPFLGLALLILLTLTCCFGPWVIQAQWFSKTLGTDYSILQMSNWFWTVGELNDDSVYNDATRIGILCMGGAMLLFGFWAARTAGRELLFLPESIPNRVMEEELARRRNAPPAEMKHPLDD